MFGLPSSRFLLRVPNRNGFAGEFFVMFRLFCSHMKEDKQPFAVSYLKNSLRFSEKDAILASRGLKFETPDAPDSVLALFRDHGFTEAQIFKLVKKQSGLLATNPKRTLLPKIQFFYSVGLTKAQVSHLLSSNPYLLHYSLNHTIIPWFNFLKELLNLNEKVVMVLKRPFWEISRGVQQNVVPNIAFLRDIGVPESRILALVTGQPRVLAQTSEKFRKLVAKVLEMGFQPLEFNFVSAIIIFLNFKKSTLERKMEVYRGYGWSDNDIHMAMKANPLVVSLSEKKITSGMDFLVKRMSWPVADIARDPVVLFYSLEKRLIPRCSVVEVLKSKGLINKGVPLGSILKTTEKQFLDRFVNRFQQDLPELLGVYQGNSAALKLTEVFVCHPTMQHGYQNIRQV